MKLRKKIIMYIIEHRQQIERIRELTQLRKNQDTFEVFYHDPSSGNMWRSFFPQANGRVRGPKLLRTHPLPDNLEKQLNICLNSEDINDAKGLALEYSAKPDNWISVIKILQNNRKSYKRQHLKAFLSLSGLTHPQKTVKELDFLIKNIRLTKERLSLIQRKARKILFLTKTGL